MSDSEEKLLADLQPDGRQRQNVFSILSNADFPYPTVTLSDGRSVRLDPAGYNAARAVPNRADREKAMSAFFTSLGGFSRTFGTTMNAEAQKVLFHAKARRYATALESELDGPNIPVSVYIAARRGREPQPALVPSLSEAAQAHDGRGPSCTTTISTRRSCRR